MDKGFSLIETLIAITLSSLILMALSQNLALLTHASHRLAMRAKAGNHAALSLLLLHQQLESAQMTECTDSAPLLAAEVDPETLISLQPYAVIPSQDGSRSNALMIHHLQRWNGSNGLVLVDDCVHAKIFRANTLDLKGFQKPLTVSLIETRVYSAEPNADGESLWLARRINEGHTEKIYGDLATIEISAPDAMHVKINILPFDSTGAFNAPYTLLYNPPGA